MAYTILMVPREPKKPFSIRILGSNQAWLCANTFNVANWHFANSPGMTGVTEYATEYQAKRAIVKFRNSSSYRKMKVPLEIVRFKA